mgnify:CR=1 FL=1
MLRLLGDASHSYPHFGHSHQTLANRFSVMSAGVKLPFLVGCHSAANAGFFSSKEPRSATLRFVKVSPFFCFAHSGHPLFLLPARCIIAVCHSCLHSAHLHQTLSLELMPNISGFRFPFFSVSHSRQRSGLSCIRELGMGVKYSRISLASLSKSTVTELCIWFGFLRVHILTVILYCSFSSESYMYNLQRPSTHGRYVL